jgi:hypothetical protein
MAQVVVMGAMLRCSFGLAPSSLVVLPQPVPIFTGGPLAATILDHKPFVNILPFGMCTSPSNPAVIAAMGSPVPCVPVIPAPWTPGSPTVTYGAAIVLNSTSTCMCTWAGVITVQSAGQATTQVP